MAKFLEILVAVLALSIMVVLVRTYVLEDARVKTSCAKALDSQSAVQGSNSPE